MPVLNPTRAQFEAMLAMPADQPVYMLNLLRFREQADYGERTDQNACSGRAAYARYGAGIAEILKGVGGRPVWQGDGQLTFIAPEGESWDECLLVRYPDMAAFQAMLTNPDYQAQTFHRDAALLDARLVITHTALVDFPAAD
ncbi:uncharacterized protein (DUF1330 family) [Litorivivens lipolytica]|uniref:Uncharacterized protein (DUF1330 family) n=1 Tax=Litorivivens lipolytica TaxID=1524264 RepID=A0A7W4Z5K5_9GAMM|nr:DUF1330 domain-containing protein [Litorivivens lipolytica]MBB3047584.1 uncharacterized protein (DUF1330 family) [Litorivivens lipolytica]